MSKKKKSDFDPSMDKETIYRVGRTLGVRDVLHWLHQNCAFSEDFIVWTLEEDFERQEKENK